MNARLEIPSYRSNPKLVDERPIKEKDDTCDAVRMACQMELSHTLEHIRVKETGYELSSYKMGDHDLVYPIDAVSDTLRHSMEGFDAWQTPTL